jgi:hypothetical protein
LKEETIDRTRWLIRFGRGCGSILRQTAEWMNKPSNNVCVFSLKVVAK